MSTIKSSNEHLTLNADGSGKDIKFQSNGSEVASISDGGVVTATSYAGSGANLTGISSVGGATGVDFNDNVAVRLGTGNDLKFIHDGSNSYIEDTGTGALRILGSAIQFRNTADNEVMLEATPDGSVDLYHNNSIRLQTNATGIQLGMDGSLDGGIVSAIHSLFFNIDSDNNSSGQQIRFATNHNSGASGGNTLLSIKEDGRGLSEFTARAWVKFHGSGTVSIDNSHNVSSVTDVSAGTYQVNVSNNFSNVNWTAVASAGGNSAGESYTFHAQVHGASAASWGIRTSAFNNSNPWISDPESIFSVAFGD